MNAPHSKSFRSSHSRRSSSVRSKGPSLLQSTRCCGGATVEIGSIWSAPARRTVSRMPSAEPSSSCDRTAIRRASARLTSMEFVTFVLSQLPPPPARVLEVGCGDEGGVTPALLEAGYDVLAIDPHAPAGEPYRQITLEELDDPGPFAAVVACRGLPHVHTHRSAFYKPLLLGML